MDLSTAAAVAALALGLVAGLAVGVIAWLRGVASLANPDRNP